MGTHVKSARRLFGAMVVAALSFGASQAFAVREMSVSEGEYCTGAGAIQACWQDCTARYGEGTQATCSRWDYWTGYYYGSTPVCQCIR